MTSTTKTTKTTKTKTAKASRTVVKLEAGEKKMNVIMNGTSVSASVLSDGTRHRGKATKYETIEEAKAAFEATVSAATKAGWSRKVKTLSVDDLIGMAETE